jgi:hypothetical protein
MILEYELSVCLEYDCESRVHQHSEGEGLCSGCQVASQQGTTFDTARRSA